jgi:hypothetical protein
LHQLIDDCLAHGNGTAPPTPMLHDHVTRNPPGPGEKGTASVEPIKVLPQSVTEFLKQVVSFVASRQETPHKRMQCAGGSREQAQELLVASFVSGA